jgi:hypothetical protein
MPASMKQQNPEELRKQATNEIAGLPLYFEANRGQVDPSVRYLARSGSYSLFLTNDAAVFSLISGEMNQRAPAGRLTVAHDGETKLTESAVRARLVGANPHPEVEGLEPLPARVNCLIGERRNWHRDIPVEDPDDRHHATIFMRQDVAMIDKIADVRTAKIHADRHARIRTGARPVRDLNRVMELLLRSRYRHSVDCEQHELNWWM